MPRFFHSRGGGDAILPAGLVLLAGTIVTFALILGGLFDPRPIGERVWSIEPAVRGEPGVVEVESGGQVIRWLEDASPLPAAYTIRLTAAALHGEVDSGYGLALGGVEQPLTIAVSPLGYVAIRQGDEALVPWQTWPHVRMDRQANEIWLDVQPSAGGNVATVRLNRELLWSGEVVVCGSSVGLLVESFGGAAAAEFKRLELFSPFALHEATQQEAQDCPPEDNPGGVDFEE